MVAHQGTRKQKAVVNQPTKGLCAVREASALEPRPRESPWRLQLVGSSVALPESFGSSTRMRGPCMRFTNRTLKGLEVPASPLADW
jgi:hypothetical protein